MPGWRGLFSLVDQLAFAYLIPTPYPKERPVWPSSRRAPWGRTGAAGDRAVPVTMMARLGWTGKSGPGVHRAFPEVASPTIAPWPQGRVRSPSFCKGGFRRDAIAAAEIREKSNRPHRRREGGAIPGCRSCAGSGTGRSAEPPLPRPASRRSNHPAPGRRAPRFAAKHPLRFTAKRPRCRYHGRGRFTAKHPGTEGRTVGEIVAFLNRKGGVGKTSTCHHLGGALAGRGRRVLLVDADPQASLTQGLLGPEAARELRPRETIAALYGDQADGDAGRLIRPLAIAGLSLLARVGGPGPLQPPRAVDLRRRPVPAPRRPGRGPRRLRLDPDRLPPPRLPVGLVGAWWPPTAWSCLCRPRTTAPGDRQHPRDRRSRPRRGQSAAAAARLPGDHVQQVARGPHRLRPRPPRHLRRRRLHGRRPAGEGLQGVGDAPRPRLRLQAPLRRGEGDRRPRRRTAGPARRRVRHRHRNRRRRGGSPDGHHQRQRAGPRQPAGQHDPGRRGRARPSTRRPAPSRAGAASRRPPRSAATGSSPTPPSPARSSTPRSSSGSPGACAIAGSCSPSGSGGRPRRTAT